MFTHSHFQTNLPFSFPFCIEKILAALLEFLHQLIDPLAIINAFVADISFSFGLVREFAVGGLPKLFQHVD